MPDISGRQLLSEWRKVMDSTLASAASIGGGVVPQQLLEAMQRQLDLVHEVIERERAVQKQLAGHVLAPVDAVFDLLEESGTMLRSQAEALETAGVALEQTARLVKSQAELFERAIGTLRAPSERTKAALGVERRAKPPKGGARSGRGSG